jgi:hypothetical protein
MPVVLKPTSPSLPPAMLRTLLVSFGVFTVLSLGFTVTRYGLSRREDQEDARHAE